MSEAIETYQNLITNKVRRFAQSIAPSKAVPRMKISVVDGLHAGFETTDQTQALRIGSGHDCDIVLLDDGIEEVHATLVFDMTMLGEVVRVTTSAKDVLLNQTKLVQSVPSAFDSTPAVLKIGPVSINIVGDRSQDQKPGRYKRTFLDRLLKSGMVVLLLFGFLMALDWLGRTAGAINYTVLLPTQANAETQETAVDADGMTLLRDRLEVANLNRHLTLEQPSPFTIVVKGTLPQSKMAQWQEVHRWFDGQPTATLLTAQVKAAPLLSDFPAISAIRLSEPPQVTFLDGTQVKVGGSVQDGWIVTAIEVDGLSLQRADEELKIGF